MFGVLYAIQGTDGRHGLMSRLDHDSIGGQCSKIRPRIVLAIDMYETSLKAERMWNLEGRYLDIINLSATRKYRVWFHCYFGSASCPPTTAKHQVPYRPYTKNNNHPQVAVLRIKHKLLVEPIS